VADQISLDGLTRLPFAVATHLLDHMAKTKMDQMLATSVFSFRWKFHFNPFIKGENDHLEIVLKSLAAGKIFLV